jgi:AraC-like DNA-binding protein
VELALRAISSRYAKKITLGDLAVKLGVDRTTLYRRVIHSTGRSPSEILHATRIKAACQLLSDAGSRYTIAQIGAMVGYPEYQRFHAMFKKETGDTPTASRDLAS